MNPKPMQDVKPSSPKTTPAASTDLIQAEIEHGIPVKDPEQPAANSTSGQNPITQPGQFVEEGSKNDSELEHILKDVNQSVTKQDKKTDKKPKFSLFKKSEEKKPVVPDTKNKNPRPMLAVAMAIIVAGILGAAAVYAFKQGKTAGSNAGQSTASNKKPLSAVMTNEVQQDIKNLSSSLQSQINSLNDEQDFNQADLSDQTLGL